MVFISLKLIKLMITPLTDLWETKYSQEREDSVGQPAEQEDRNERDNLWGWEMIDSDTIVAIRFSQLTINRTLLCLQYRLFRITLSSRCELYIIFLNLTVLSVPIIDFTNLSIKNINDTTNRLRRKYETFFPYVRAHDSGEISIILANSCGGIVCGYLTVSG